MKDVIFITGNQHKADFLAKRLGMQIEHRKIDLDEIQSLDPRAVTEHKVRQAYAVAKRPVLVEDIALTFTAMKRLPGTFIKWFLEELGTDGLCRLADGLAHREAVATVCYGFYDGKRLQFFESRISGQVAAHPRGDHGFGWDSIFIPEGATKTYGEMTPDEAWPLSLRAPTLKKLREFLA